ncbi:MAG: hypothetical protein IPJ90_10005 [Anaerolineaceae bacterium]|nr:hypothetical protein [Anaerolineaceae bacterium]
MRKPQGSQRHGDQGQVHAMHPPKNPINKEEQQETHHEAHIGTYAIWFDTAVPGWVAVNDKQQHSFGNGARGEQAAIRHALRAAFPQVAAAVEHLCAHFPEAASRGWAAAELLVLGFVLTPDPTEPDELARVRSQRQERWYRLLQQADGRLACDCPDYEQGGLALASPPLANQLLCKHLLAYFLAGHLAWSLTEATPVPLHPKTQHGRSFSRAGGPVRGPPQRPPAHQQPGQPPAVATGSRCYPHLSHYRSYVATPSGPSAQEKLLSWSLGR